MDSDLTQSVTQKHRHTERGEGRRGGEV